MFVYQVTTVQSERTIPKTMIVSCKLIVLEINKYIVQKHLYTVHTVHNYITYRFVCQLVV